MSLNNPGRAAWKTVQVSLDKNPPVFNTLHEVFSAAGGVRLVQIEVYQTNTPTNAAEIDVIITLNGTPYTYDSSSIGMLNNAGYYFVFMQGMDAPSVPSYAVHVGDTVALGYSTKCLQSYGAAGADKPLEGTSIKVEVRQTSALDAGARIRVKATYEVLEVL